MYLFETLSCLHSSSCARSVRALFKIVTFRVLSLCGMRYSVLGQSTVSF